MTSRELYNRIRWDQRVDASKVTVGYEDRFRGVLEMPFADQRVGADVPWHRIVHFHYDGQLLWDRHGNLNLGLLTETQASGTKGCFKWDANDECWSAHDVSSQQSWHSQVKVLSWNILFDLYDQRVPKSELRFPKILERLQNCDAGLVCLQEVTPKVATWLLEDDWIRENYFSSLAEPEKELTPYGPLVLSKLPITLVHRALSAGKTLVHGVIEFQTGPVHLINLHLFSDRKSGAENLRMSQLQEALAYVDPTTDCWIVGDFNMRSSLVLPGFGDVWELLQTEDYGLSYDPVGNSLARLTTTTNRAARFDRILMRGSWTPTKTRLEREADPPSDHFPLTAELWSPILAEPVHQSALVVIPPKEEWSLIQSVRSEHDKSFERWMPHINLLYGFVPEKHFERAARLLKSQLERRPSFEVRLREYQRFEHRQSTTIWLKPECTPEGSLVELQRELQMLFPKCREQSSHSSNGFTPHLTVASISRGKSLPTLPKIDLTFTVDTLHLISREARTPFEIRESVHLSERSLVSCLPVFRGKDAAITQIKNLCEKQGCKALAVGSQGLGLDLPWSDVDCLVVGYQSAKEFFDTLPDGRFVAGRIPLWRMNYHEVKIDLQYAQYPRDLSLDAPIKEAWERLKDAVRSRMELETLLARQPHESYLKLLREVRCWTHNRVLDNPAFGLPGGWAWTVLVLQFREQFKLADMAKFFQWLRDWWKSESSVLSLVEPRVDLAPNITATTFDVLSQEIDRAEHLARRYRWKTLFQTILPERSATLVIESGGEQTLEECEGWLCGTLVGLMVDCERSDTGGRLRPLRFENDGSCLYLTFLVSGRPCERVLERFLRQITQWYGSRERVSIRHLGQTLTAPRD